MTRIEGWYSVVFNIANSGDWSICYYDGKYWYAVNHDGCLYDSDFAQINETPINSTPPATQEGEDKEHFPGDAVVRSLQNKLKKEEGEDVRKEAAVNFAKFIIDGQWDYSHRTNDWINGEGDKATTLQLYCRSLTKNPASSIDKEEETIDNISNNIFGEKYIDLIGDSCKLRVLERYLKLSKEEETERGITFSTSEEKNTSVTEDIKSFTFEELVQYGLNSGTIHIHDGVPWSFDYKGIAITHENDECYIIPWKGTNHRFTPADILIIDSRRNVSVISKSDLEKFQNALFPHSEPSTIPVVDYEKEAAAAQNILAQHIARYNAGARDIDKFKLHDKEVKMFTGAMIHFARQMSPSDTNGKVTPDKK